MKTILIVYGYTQWGSLDYFPSLHHHYCFSQSGFEYLQWLPWCSPSPRIPFCPPPYCCQHKLLQSIFDRVYLHWLKTRIISFSSMFIKPGWGPTDHRSSKTRPSLSPKCKILDYYPHTGNSKISKSPVFLLPRIFAFPPLDRDPYIYLECCRKAPPDRSNVITLNAVNEWQRSSGFWGKQSSLYPSEF